MLDVSTAICHCCVSVLLKALLAPCLYLMKHRRHKRPTAMSLIAAEPAGLGTIKSDIAGKLWSKFATISGQLERMVMQGYLTGQNQPAANPNSSTLESIYGRQGT
jgi:hypothetical protein